MHGDLKHFASNVYPKMLIGTNSNLTKMNFIITDKLRPLEIYLQNARKYTAVTIILSKKKNLVLKSFSRNEW